jgi:hypothetical protein
LQHPENIAIFSSIVQHPGTAEVSRRNPHPDRFDGSAPTRTGYTCNHYITPGETSHARQNESSNSRSRIGPPNPCPMPECRLGRRSTSGGSNRCPRSPPLREPAGERFGWTLLAPGRNPAEPSPDGAAGSANILLADSPCAVGSRSIRPLRQELLPQIGIP